MKFKFDITSSDPCGILGRTFGKLTVIGYDGHYPDKRYEQVRWHYWYKVRCSCRAHTEFITTYRELMSGNTAGCLKCKRGEPVLPGDKFGHLTVLNILPPPPGKKHAEAICKCDCPKGTVIKTTITRLKSGITKTCGDSWHYIKKEYSGRLKLGMQPNSDIEVLEIYETKRSAKGERMAKCKCHHVNLITQNECGKVFDATVSNILTGNTTSCGCAHNFYPDESTAKLGNKWFGMKYRCNMPSCQSYDDYGGRGIKITPEWDTTREGRAAFIRDGINKGFVDGQSIDRINNDKGYSPDNVRYVGWTEQNNNKRNNHYVTVEGTTLTLAEWAKLLSINRVMLHNKMRFCKNESEYIRRLMHREISPFDRIPQDLCAPHKVRADKGKFRDKDTLTIRGVTKGYREWETEYQVYPYFIINKLSRGFSKEQIIDLLDEWKTNGKLKRKSDRFIEVDGLSLNATDWARKLGIAQTWMYSKLRHYDLDTVKEFIRTKLKENQNEKNNC